MRSVILILLGVLVLVLVVTAVFLFRDNSSEWLLPLDNQESEVSCDLLCENLSLACPTMVDRNACATCCSIWSEEEQLNLQAVDSCESFSQVEDLLSCGTTNQVGEEKNCQPACTNYVQQCLTLVPNATDALLWEGMNSCMDHCQLWDNEKIGCLANANDCPSMTEVCGL